MARSTGSPELGVEELDRGLTAAEVSELEAGEENPFDSDGTLRWGDKDRFAVVRDRSDGRLVAAAGLVTGTVTVGAAGSFDVVGLGDVLVRVDRRRTGLARTVVLAALELAATLGPSRAMLFCWPDRAGLYARLGFAPVAGAVTVGQPDGATAPMHMETMWRALAPGATWPPGAVTLDGLPF